MSPTRTVIFIRHGDHRNVIRHWLCKALQIGTDNWTRFNVAHASLTTIHMDNKGHFVVLGFSEVGHLPENLRTP